MRRFTCRACQSHRQVPHNTSLINSETPGPRKLFTNHSLSSLVIINRSQNDNADEVALQSQATTAAVVKLQRCQQVSSSRRAESERLSPVAGNAGTESTTLAGKSSTKARARRPRGRPGHGQVPADARFQPVEPSSTPRTWDRLPPGGEYGWMHLQDLHHSFDLGPASCK